MAESSTTKSSQDPNMTTSSQDANTTLLSVPETISIRESCLKQLRELQKKWAQEEAQAKAQAKAQTPTSSSSSSSSSSRANKTISEHKFVDGLSVEAERTFFPKNLPSHRLPVYERILKQIEDPFQKISPDVPPFVCDKQDTVDFKRSEGVVDDQTNNFQCTLAKKPTLRIFVEQGEKDTFIVTVCIDARVDEETNDIMKFSSQHMSELQCEIVFVVDAVKNTTYVLQSNDWNDCCNDPNYGLDEEYGVADGKYCVHRQVDELRTLMFDSRFDETKNCIEVDFTDTIIVDTLAAVLSSDYMRMINQEYHDICHGGESSSDSDDDSSFSTDSDDEHDKHIRGNSSSIMSYESRILKTLFYPL